MEIQDIDIYGRETRPGTPKEVFQEDAVKNALILLLTSKRGEFLYNSFEGGVLDDLLFKPMTSSSISIAEFKIRNALTNHFVPPINIQAISVQPDYNKRIFRILVYYKGVFTKQEEQLVFHTEGNFESKEFSYQEVPYKNDNLEAFCMLKKADNLAAKLLFNTEEDCWIWGIYKFINLVNTDPNFAAILSICNLSA